MNMNDSWNEHEVVEGANFLAKNVILRQHERLIEWLKELHLQAMSQTNALAELEQIGSSAKDFLKLWERHVQWQEQELFPRISLPSSTSRIGPIAVMMQDYVLAKHYLQSFIYGTEMLHNRVLSMDPIDVLSDLLQACIIMEDHFRAQVDYVLPFVEQIMPDLQLHELTQD